MQALSDDAFRGVGFRIDSFPAHWKENHNFQETVLVVLD